MEVDDEVIVAMLPSAMGGSPSAESSPNAKSMLVRIPFVSIQVHLILNLFLSQAAGSGPRTTF